MKQAFKAPTDKRNDMPAALEHVLYEMNMLVHSLPSVFNDELPRHVRSGWLEIFAIHARNLNEFFGAKAQWPDDMRPEHFLSDWNTEYSFDTEIKDRADKQVAHLTYRRESREEKTNWPVERIFKNLRAPCQNFLQAVSTQQVLMNYKENHAVTVGILRGMSEVNFPHGAETNANIAVVQAQYSVTTFPVR